MSYFVRVKRLPLHEVWFNPARMKHIPLPRHQIPSTIHTADRPAMAWVVVPAYRNTLINTFLYI